MISLGAITNFKIFLVFTETVNSSWIQYNLTSHIYSLKLTSLSLFLTRSVLRKDDIVVFGIIVVGCVVKGDLNYFWTVTVAVIANWLWILNCLCYWKTSTMNVATMFFFLFFFFHSRDGRFLPLPEQCTVRKTSISDPFLTFLLFMWYRFFCTCMY